MIFPGESGRVITPAWWSLDEKLRYMDAEGITRSIVTLGNPWLAPFDVDEGVELAEIVNAELATYETRTNGRIMGMGCIPEGTVSNAVATVHAIARTEGLYGVVVGTQVCGLTLDELGLDPFWESLHETRLPLLVHPHRGLGLAELEGYGHALQLALGFPFETTTALARLAFSGALERYQNLIVIGSHGGGTIPYLAARLDSCWGPDEEARKRAPTRPSAALSRLYLDSLVYDPRALRAAADLVGSDKLMFGTDHPFAIADPSKNIEATKRAFAVEAAQILSRNAERVFGLTIDQAQ
jgi:aminocarboxymuconate-semialdehyde decarboxylase